MYEAAKLYVSILDHYPEWTDHLRSQFIQYPMGAWKQIERVGRGLALAEFLPFYGHPAITRLEKLSLADQRRYARSKVDIMVADVLGTEKRYDTRKTYVYELVGDQVDQVFAGDHIRSLAEQRSYLESFIERKRQENEDNARPYAKPWKKVDDEHILIKTPPAGMKFTRADVVEMLSVFTRAPKKK